ncbi:fatty acid desaturase [Primorskyibacter sp. S187A]|uniref:fatty acid desaturase n=1 Tax=Primorskyibacter sp. S187A TaxID=3415130 RepID=UPI003C7C0FCF
MTETHAQDYALSGAGARRAEAEGRANPKWYRTKVDPAAIRALMEKEDARPTRDALIWLGALVMSGAAAVTLWGSWWSLPFWMAYGVLYCSASDARWHECGHRTAFKTPWKNEVIYQIASFFLLRSPVVWRASHVRHHTDTIIVGRDPEIQAMRPPDLVKLLLNIFGLTDLVTHALPRYWLHLTGRVHPEEAPYLRTQDYPVIFRTARIWAVLHAGVIGAALWSGSLLPLMLVGLPRIYGAWHMWMTGVLQHLGLAENVTDHRLNTRTVLMNPISRFLYLNMNYHIEHHMFTMVPYYNLPRLHALIAHDLPPPEPSIPAAFGKLVPVMLKQVQQEKAVILPQLPPTAAPFGAEAEVLRPYAM